MKKSFFIGMILGTVGTSLLMQKTKDSALLQKVMKK